MRICPECSAYYADASIGFCLVDGSPLVNVDPGSDKWREGSRAIEEKAMKLTKQKRKLKWRWIVLGGMTMFILTMVMAKSFRIETTPPYKISGRVTDAGEAVAGVQILLGGGKTAATATDIHGNYTFGNLPAGVSYTITPVITDTKFTPPSLSISRLTKDESADFVRVKPVYKISGQVTDARGPLIGVTIRLSGPRSGSKTTDANGNYAFSDLPAGNYTVTPARERTSFTPPSAPLILSQDRSADFAEQIHLYKITGQVTDARGPLIGVTIRLSGPRSGSKTTDANGNYAFSDLPAGGNYTITPASESTSFTPPSISLILSQDRPANNFIGRVERDRGPECTDADQARERDGLRNRYAASWQRSIESEKARIIDKTVAESLPGVPRQMVEVTASLDPIRYEVAFLGCTPRLVTARYVWQVKMYFHGMTKVVAVPRQKTCGKVVGTWLCR